MAKLTPELEDLVVAHVSKGATYGGVQGILLREHGVTISKQALWKAVQRHRSQSTDAAKLVVRAHIGPTLPSDLNAFDTIMAQTATLHATAHAEALLHPSQTNVTKVTQLARTWLSYDEAKKRAMGLEQPDEVVRDLATLLARARG